MTSPKPGLFKDNAVLWALAVFNLLLHFATASRLDFYIDEIYSYILLPRHAPIGFVDASAFPLGIWLSVLPTYFLGCTTFTLRIAAAVAASANILAAGLLARELGGSRHAVILTGLSVLVAPFLLFAAGLSEFTIESLPWTVSALFIVRVLRTGNGRLWWLVGLSWGAVLMNKPTVVFFMMGTGLGLLFTRARGELFKKGYWLAIVFAIVLFAPALIWQAIHGWPFLTFMGRISKDEYADTGNWLAYFSRAKMLLAQPALLGPVNCLLAIAAVFYPCVSKRENGAMVVLWALLITIIAFLAASGRPYYMHPMYSILLAYGCVAAVRVSEWTGARWLRHFFAAGLLMQGLLLAPLCVPVLPRNELAGYANLVCRGPLVPLRSTATVLQGTIVYESLATLFNMVYMTLPDDQKRDSCILVGCAPAAAGVEYYGAQYGLPRVFSPDLNYRFWGVPEEGTKTVLAAYFYRDELESWFGHVEPSAVNNKVYICRSPKSTYREMWKDICRKDYTARWKMMAEDTE